MKNNQSELDRIFERIDEDHFEEPYVCKIRSILELKTEES